MAKYSVTYVCGHADTVQLDGPGSDRERKLKWMERECLCPECYKKAREQEKADAATAAATANLEKGFSALTEGTPAQIGWAEVIRAAHVAALEDARTPVAKPGEIGDDRFRPLATLLTSTILWAKSITSAQWWIDNRAGPSDMARMLSFLSVKGRSAPADANQMVKRLLSLSPHMTEELAAQCGISASWLAAAAETAQKRVAAEDTASMRALADRARALGWKGAVKPWWKESSNGRNLRLYLNDMGDACVRWIGGQHDTTVKFEGGLTDSPEARALSKDIWNWCNGAANNKLRNLSL